MHNENDKTPPPGGEETIIATPAEQYLNNTVALNEKTNAAAKEQIAEEVKESFKEENIPVEPILGDDGMEVGGQG